MFKCIFVNICKLGVYVCMYVCFYIRVLDNSTSHLAIKYFNIQYIILYFVFQFS